MPLLLPRMLLSHTAGRRCSFRLLLLKQRQQQGRLISISSSTSLIGSSRPSSNNIMMSTPSPSITRHPLPPVDDSSSSAPAITAGLQQQTRRSFHFGTRSYAECFENLPQPDTKWLRETTLDYLEKEFDVQRWYDDPMVSLLNGKALSLSSSSSSAGSEDSSAVVQETKNALGQVNGKQILASSDDLELLKQHICTYQSASTDLRDVVRQMEQDIFTLHSGFLIGNQCVDFQKQDGITEMEEAIQANVVERRLNDLLLEDEKMGVITVNRKPIYVCAVSNFTNFLDLSRKTIRSLEVGIPVIILSRSNTSQHVFRWTQKLVELGQQHGLDDGMITYVSASLADIQALTRWSAGQDYTGNLYTTCSRDLARDITASYPNTIASTQGPNTLVVTNTMSVRASAVVAAMADPDEEMPKLDADGNPIVDVDEETKKKKKDDKDDDDESKWSNAVREAIRQSATIESSGQCTALRHAVIPMDTTEDQVRQVFDNVTVLKGGAAPDAVQQGQFDGVFGRHEGSAAPATDDGYQYQEASDSYYTIRDTLPPPGIQEYWRKVVVDFTKLDVSREPEHFEKLVTWLNENQPISLAVNGPRQEAYNLGLKLFDKTSLVVMTLGSTDQTDTMPPALTCQARPQEGECFGEFPPRSSIRTYTKFPVVVPSSNPSYDATYRPEYLEQQAVSEYFGKSTRTLLNHVKSNTIRGYCVMLIRYLQDVDQKNPKQGFNNNNRTTLWGLQRPPLGSKTVVHCAADAPWDAIAPLYTLFHVTTARDQIELSVHPENEALIAICQESKLAHVVETHDEMKARLETLSPNDIFAVETKNGDDVMTDFFPMAGQFTSLYLPLGHLKSTKPNDEEFLFRAQAQTWKWLTTVF